MEIFLKDNYSSNSVSGSLNSGKDKDFRSDSECYEYNFSKIIENEIKSEKDSLHSEKDVSRTQKSTDIGNIFYSGKDQIENQKEQIDNKINKIEKLLDDLENISAFLQSIQNIEPFGFLNQVIDKNIFIENISSMIEIIETIKIDAEAAINFYNQASEIIFSQENPVSAEQLDYFNEIIKNLNNDKSSGIISETMSVKPILNSISSADIVSDKKFKDSASNNFQSEMFKILENLKENIQGRDINDAVNKMNFLMSKLSDIQSDSPVYSTDKSNSAFSDTFFHGINELSEMMEELKIIDFSTEESERMLLGSFAKKNELSSLLDIYKKLTESISKDTEKLESATADINILYNNIKKIMGESDNRSKNNFKSDSSDKIMSEKLVKNSEITGLLSGDAVKKPSSSVNESFSDSDIFGRHIKNQAEKEGSNSMPVKEYSQSSNNLSLSNFVDNMIVSDGQLKEDEATKNLIKKNVNEFSSLFKEKKDVNDEINKVADNSFKSKTNTNAVLTTSAETLKIESPGTNKFSFINNRQELPFDQKNIIDQLLNKININLADAKTSISMSLKPAHLGQVDFELVFKDGAVIAKFAAQSNQVKEAIQAGFNELKDSLEQQGLSISGLEVSLSQEQDRGNHDIFSESIEYLIEHESASDVTVQKNDDDYSYEADIHKGAVNLVA